MHEPLRLSKKPGYHPGFYCQSEGKCRKFGIFDTSVACGRVICMRRATLTVSLHTSFPSAAIGFGVL